MDDILRQLELQIKKLIEQQMKLQQANANLHDVKNNLTRERARLLNKHNQTVSQIKSLVTKLKAIERLP